MPTQHNNEKNELATLRALVPPRPLTFLEALRIAELQANRLRRLLAIDDDAFPTDLIGDFARMRIVERANMPVSGASYWTDRGWVIAVNSSEPWQRRRLTTLHELKHIVDHGRTKWLYRGDGPVSAEQQAEQAADYFAGCVLVPKQLLKRAFGEGVQRPGDLAEIFAVSEPAIRVRLAQTGLADEQPRRDYPDQRGHRTYYRSATPRSRTQLQARVMPGHRDPAPVGGD